MNEFLGGIVVGTLLYVVAIGSYKILIWEDDHLGKQNKGTCKDMLEGFINGQFASALGTLQLENIKKEFQKSLHDKDSEIKQLKQGMESLKGMIDTEQNRSTSIVYTRWGRDDCPAHSLTEYSGFTGGSHYTHTGAAAEPLCLPPEPEWGLHTESADDSRAIVYGAEYEFHSLTDSRKKLHQYDVPCAVCRVKEISVVITIPARKSCYSGWNQEYKGYLVAGYYNHKAATQYTCIDENSKGIPGTQGDNNGYLFYPVEGRCGSLACPPYVNGRELTCVVCSI
ncbi:hypothetical protein FSP39_011731 [Pinctada imbricata]|uniref:Short-chain collagen C4-like n=1 Tax=Pinctada imbricata TaxID=66713 RepID=A0AA88YMD4_PINIB|nr:hypothetical protein FSP39_011731 [Pinctada imbricata]